MLFNRSAHSASPSDESCVCCSWPGALPQHHVTTTSVLPQHYLTATSLLPQHYLSTTSALPHCYLAATSLLPHYYLAATSLLPHCYLAATSLLPHCCLSATPTHGLYLSGTLGAGWGQSWTVFGRSWELLVPSGGVLVSSWELSGWPRAASGHLGSFWGGQGRSWAQLGTFVLAG